MEQIEFLEQELLMMLENIKRVKKYTKDEENKKWKPYQSNVVGELKHRAVALKTRLTLINKISTYELF